MFGEFSALEVVETFQFVIRKLEKIRNFSYQNIYCAGNFF